MVRLMKLMTADMKDAKGTSMLEDYTYNLVPGKEGILQAHMLEICPTISEGPISIKCQPLSMGDREDPARLVFTSKEGEGIAASLIDLGDRFRLLINTVECIKNEKPMPKLPVATAFWTPKPDFATGCEAWILAGGAHHTAFTYDLTAEQMGDWAAAMGGGGQDGQNDRADQPRSIACPCAYSGKAFLPETWGKCVLRAAKFKIVINI